MFMPEYVDKWELLKHIEQRMNSIQQNCYLKHKDKKIQCACHDMQEELRGLGIYINKKMTLH